MKFNLNIQIGDQLINKESEVFIIAEAGVNHNGDMELARKLVDVAVDAGVHAVKFQSFKTEELILENVTKADYQQKTTSQSESQFRMLKRLEISHSQTKDLQNYCKKKGILFMTTPFDEFSLDELDELDLPAYKVSSTDLTNIPFLRRIAKKSKPVIISSGMSYLEEVRTALEAMHPFNKDVILLQCTANYPTDDAEVNLDVFKTYAETFEMLLGFSDHTIGVGASPYSVLYNAKVIEKHFTLDKSMDGPDHSASLSPIELKQLVIEIKRASKFVGQRTKEPTKSELGNREKMQKCLVATRSIKKDEAFSEENIIGKRTGGTGISALEFDKVVGRFADRSYTKNDIIELSE